MFKNRKMNTYEDLSQSLKSLSLKIYTFSFLFSLLIIGCEIFILHVVKPKIDIRMVEIKGNSEIDLCYMGVRDLIRQNENSNILGEEIKKTLNQSDFKLSHFEITSMSNTKVGFCDVSIKDGNINKHIKISFDFYAKSEFKKIIKAIEVIDQKEI